MVTESRITTEIPQKPDIYTALIKRADGKILLTKRRAEGDKPEQWALFSGIGSSSKFHLKGLAAAAGEVTADISNVSFDGVEAFEEKFPADSKAGSLHFYEGTIDKTKISDITKTHRSMGLKWVTIDEALQLDLAFDHHELLQKYQHVKHQETDEDHENIEAFYEKL